MPFDPSDDVLESFLAKIVYGGKILNLKDLVQKAGWEELTEQEIAFVVQSISKAEANHSYGRLGDGIFILDKAGAMQYRTLLEH